MMLIALSMRPIELSALPAVAPATLVVAASSVVSDNPPKVSVIWSLAVLLRPIWKVICWPVVETSCWPLNLEEPWMRLISALRELNSVSR
jgi:hypothetical protein